MRRYILAIAAAILFVTEAAAIECAAAPQSRQDYWSWRTIDGKKCWYRGRPGMSKTKLRWSTATVGQRAVQTPDDERAPAEPDTARDIVPPRDIIQSNALNAQPERELTFEERWPN